MEKQTITIKQEKKNKFVSFRVSKSDLEKLNSLAEVRKKNRSDLLRTIFKID
jgi:hypothetical protein